MALLVPADWRRPVADDLEEEAETSRHTQGWRAWQVVKVGLALRWALGGSAMWFELQMSMRSLWRARWFTLGAAATFAVGVGLSLAVFSTVDRVLFRPLPYADAHELVLLRRCSQSGACRSGSFPAPLAYAAQSRLTTLGEIGVVGLQSTVSLAAPTGDEPRLPVLDGSANLLRVLGVAPILGRDVTDDDVAQQRPVVLLGHDAWVRHFNADPGVVGRHVWRGEEEVPIIGILPPGFLPPGWTSPIGAGLLVAHRGWATIGPTGGIAAPVARLRPGASVSAAQEEIRALATALEAEAPLQPGSQPVVIRVDPLNSHLFDRWAEYASLIMSGAALVLVMACVNLAGLFLARGRSRERDAALRTALGATRARLVLATLIETLFVSAAGTGVAVLVLLAMTPTLTGQLPPVFQQFSAEIVDLRVMLFAVAATLVAGVGGGLWPGWRATRRQVSAALAQGGPSRHGRLPGGRSLLIVQSALSVCLVVGASAAAWSFERLASDDIGFVPDDLFLLTPSAARGTPPAQVLTEYEAAIEAVRGLPAVEAVAGGDAVVAGPWLAMRDFVSEGAVSGGRFEVSAGYFQAIGGALLAGREFTQAEVATRSPVGIVSASAASALWPGESPVAAVGRFLELPGEAAGLVVGVTADLLRTYGSEPRPALFVPLGADPSNYGPLLVRMRRGTAPSFEAVRQRVLDAAPGWRMGRIAPVAQSVGSSVQDPRFRAVVLTAFAAAALVLAAAGLFALATYEAASRRAELGVRLTLGATANDLRRLLLAGVLVPVAVGSALGLAIAFWASTFLEAFMYEVDARDPRIYAAALIALLLTAVVAAWLPARRAARTDPAEVLRAM